MNLDRVLERADKPGMRVWIRNLLGRVLPGAGGPRNHRLQEIERIGFILAVKPRGRITCYAIFKGDGVAQLLPGSGSVFAMAELGRREKAVIRRRYRGRKLHFPELPAQSP